MPEETRSGNVRNRADILSGSVRRAVLILALPILCEQFLSFCVGFYDTWLSGRISANATTAIGLAAYVGWLASMLFALVGIGTTALVARQCGAREFDRANVTMNRSMAMAALMGIAVYGLIYVLAPVFAYLLDMDAETAEITIRYLRIDGMGHIFTALSLAGAAALRGAGDMRSPMFILGMVSLLNVIVSSALVFGVGPIPPAGIDGIVIGTVVARTIGGLLMLAGLGKGLSGLRLIRSELRVRGKTARRILRIGAPAAIDGAIMWAGQFLFLMIIANLNNGGGPMSSTIFAAHIIGIRIEAITYLPAVAWGQAAATIIGQSLGAGNRERAIQTGHEAAFQCSLLGLVITVLFFFGATEIYELMHENPDVVRIGVPAFQMLALFQIPLVVSIVYVSSLRGAGDTRYPLFFTIITALFVRLPVAYFCGIVLEGGLVGAWIGMCSDMLIRAVLATIRYSRGRWAETKV